MPTGEYPIRMGVVCLEPMEQVRNTVRCNNKNTRSEGTKMKYPFEVGNKYQNRKGEYEVIRIHEPNMDIRYSNGSTDTVKISLQARIWENMQIDASTKHQAPRKAAKTKVTKVSGKKSTSTSSRWGLEFDSLVENDFQEGTRGTNWRRRASLGGLLAILLSDHTKYKFWSYNIYGRPQVFVSVPERYEPNEWFPAAKFEFRLDVEKANIGFYIEKNDGPMTLEWDWRRMIDGLINSEELRQKLETAMHQLGLLWEIKLYKDRKPSGEIELIGKAPSSGLLRILPNNRNEIISWDNFLGQLQEIPTDVWCDLRLGMAIDKSSAMALGAHIASRAVDVYKALLPLYEISVPQSYIRYRASY